MKYKIISVAAISKHRDKSIIMNLLNENGKTYTFNNSKYYGQFRIAIYNEAEYDGNKLVKRNLWKSEHFICYFLEYCFEITLKNNEEEKTEIINTLEVDMKRLHKLCMQIACREEYKNYLLSYYIANPNSIIILRSSYKDTDYWIISNDEINEGILDFSKIKYTPSNTDLEKVWQYIHDESVFENGISKTNIGRAIVAISFMYTYKNDLINLLMLSVLSLESIYARGKESISSQLADKIMLYLPETVVDGKKIATLYNLRSRYIHGDYNFQLPYVVNSEFNPKIIELLDVYTYSMYLLINTISKAINEDRISLEYKYTISS